MKIGAFEELVLLAVGALQEEAYGVARRISSSRHGLFAGRQMSPLQRLLAYLHI